MFRSPLHSAVYYRHFDTVKFLIEKGFDFKKCVYTSTKLFLSYLDIYAKYFLCDLL